MRLGPRATGPHRVTGTMPQTAPVARWIVAELSVVPQRGEFLVGDATTGAFVVLPAIGVEVIEWLRAGHPLEAVAGLARDRAGEVVDVAAFVADLESLGFVRDGSHDTDGTDDDAAKRPEQVPPRSTFGTRCLDVIARACFGRTAWFAIAAATVLCGAAFVVRPALFPRASDIFFLSTPARSLAALTAISYVLAAAHEGAHWLAARAVGVPASVGVGRRLYFLALETDLTGLWAQPPTRRWRPIVAGMAFDIMVLAVVLSVRISQGSTHPGGVGKLLAALTVIEVAAVAAQFLFFMRTDVYALLVTLTRTVNLYRTTQLSLLALARLATRGQTEELRRAPVRDAEVARWYRWVWLVGMAVASWFFAVIFVPATVRTAEWVGSVAWPIRPASGSFWEAVGLSVVIASPEALTAAVALRELRRRYF